MPSLYEGFGLPVLEAMSCGCPVVTSNAGSLPEITGDGAQTFDPTDTAGMADAVLRLLSDSEERERWKKAGLRRSAEFSWATTAARTMCVYRQVCGMADHSAGVN
jgi:alpha-1,3-rhamnosyl/mannosyltransferase